MMPDEPIAWLGRIPYWLLPWVLTYLIHSSILLSSAWLLDRRVILSWRVREFAWKAAVIGAVLSAAVQVILTSTGGNNPTVVVESAAVDGRESRTPPLPVVAGEPGSTTTSPIRLISRGYRIPLSSAVLSPRLPEESTVSYVRPAVGLLLLTWIVGALGGLLSVIKAQIRLRTLFASRTPVADRRAEALLQDLCRAAGHNRDPRLTEMAGLPGPVAIGHREICLPSGLVSALDVDHLRAVLAHELAHLARRDPAWFRALFVIESMLFIQPLNRLASRRIREAAEILADDWATMHVGRVALARCIAIVAASHARGALGLRLAGMTGIGPLSERVERLLSPPARECHVNSFFSCTIAAAALAIVISCAPVVAVGARPQDAAGLFELARPTVLGRSSNFDHEGTRYHYGSNVGPVRIAHDGTYLYGSTSHEVHRLEWITDHYSDLNRGWVRFESSGLITFSPYGTKVSAVSDGGYFTVEVYDGNQLRRLLVRLAATGDVEYVHSVDEVVAPWDPEAHGAGWLGPLVRELIRTSAIDTSGEVGGPATPQPAESLRGLLQCRTMVSRSAQPRRPDIPDSGTISLRGDDFIATGVARWKDGQRVLEQGWRCQLSRGGNSEWQGDDLEFGPTRQVPAV